MARPNRSRPEAFEVGLGLLARKDSRAPGLPNDLTRLARAREVVEPTPSPVVSRELLLELGVDIGRLLGFDFERGTLAMARTAEVDSATSQFFINTGTKNAFLDHKVRDYGYAVFGKVVGGMDVVDKIESVKTAGEINMAVSGTVTEVNSTLADEPAKVNEDPLGAGWFFKVKTGDSIDGFMDEAAYAAYVKDLG